MRANRIQYPAYARSEKIADGTIHALGAVLALTGAALLITFAALGSPPGLVAAVAIYAGALVVSIIASACYHMTPWESIRPALRRIDHAAIYLKIAGTYTPLVVLIGSAFAYVVLACVWALALGGAVLRLVWRDVPGRMAPVVYLALGWASLLLIWPLVQALPLAGSILVCAGGLLYSAGVWFFSQDRLKFSNAIWHGFVLAASGCFFAAITVGVFA